MMLADNLTACILVGNAELTLYLLYGLGDEYDSVMVNDIQQPQCLP